MALLIRIDLAAIDRVAPGGVVFDDSVDEPKAGEREEDGGDHGVGIELSETTNIILDGKIYFCHGGIHDGNSLCIAIMLTHRVNWAKMRSSAWRDWVAGGWQDVFVCLVVGIVY
jgi:hypothetical protein